VKKRLGVDSSKVKFHTIQWLICLKYLRHCLGQRLLRTIVGIKPMVIAYACTQRGVSYFLSTFSITHQLTILYQSNFEGEFGNVNFKLIPRPHIAHFPSLYLLLIDDHSKQGQFVLNLEHKWPKKCCWFCLPTELAGQSSFDFHHLY
jgi:hypothetical protein